MGAASWAGEVCKHSLPPPISSQVPSQEVASLLPRRKRTQPEFLLASGHLYALVGDRSEQFQVLRN